MDWYTKAVTIGVFLNPLRHMRDHMYHRVHSVILGRGFFPR